MGSTKLGIGNSISRVIVGNFLHSKGFGKVGRVLTGDEIMELMAPKSKVKEKPQTTRFPAPPQYGPLRHMETSALCVVAGYWTYPDNNLERVWKKSNACRSQTHYRVQGIPMCLHHALHKLNEMLVELGVEK